MKIFKMFGNNSCCPCVPNTAKNDQFYSNCILDIKPEKQAFHDYITHNFYEEKRKRIRRM